MVNKIFLGDILSDSLHFARKDFPASFLIPILKNFDIHSDLSKLFIISNVSHLHCIYDKKKTKGRNAN